MVVAVFLPRVESTKFTFGGIAENTLIQNGDGWVLVGLAVGLAVTAYRAYRSGVKTVAVLVIAVIAIGYAVWLGSDKDSRTLYPVDPDTGDANSTAAGEVASAGVGIYLAGVGGVLALLGGFQMRNARPSAVPAAGSLPTTPRLVPPPPSSPPAGWYPDTQQAGQLRYWNGSTWTSHFQAQPGSQQPSNTGDERSWPESNPRQE